MNARGQISEADRALKALFRELVRLAGGLDAAATCVRVGRSQLASYYDMTCELFAPIDVVVALEIIAGVPLVTTEMARRSGYSLIPMDLQAKGELGCGVASLVRETGEATAAYVEASADGRIDLPEIDRMLRENQDVFRTAQNNIGVLTRMRGEFF
nr:hypothetical protein [uncultured Roseococcus sp.]